MPLKFTPNLTITPQMTQNLLSIESAKEKILHLPLTPSLLASLRETAKLYTTHYSTMIEGNRLESEEVEEVVKHHKHFPGRERDEKEVKGYYAALSQIEHWVAKGDPITEKKVQKLHALVMSNGKTNIKESSYRPDQNVIRDSRSGKIVYMPPEAQDVPHLMRALIEWIRKKRQTPLPHCRSYCPLSVCHYSPLLRWKWPHRTSAHHIYFASRQI